MVREGSTILGAGAAYVRLRHLRYRRRIFLTLEGRAHSAVSAAVHSAVLYDSEIWSLRAEDVSRLNIFHHQCFLSVDKIG